MLERHGGITYWPLAEIVRHVAPGGEEAIAGLIGDDPDAAMVADRLAAAVGMGSGDAPTEEIQWAARRLFEALARERPLVVVLDDLHWAEPTFLDLVEYVHAFSAGAPILLLCSARPEFRETSPSWSLDGERAVSVQLSPLSPAESELLVERLLAGSELPEATRGRILAAAEGNPLFVEQMLALVAQDGNGGSETVVPPTIKALLAARLDRLPLEERAVAEHASVEGRLFHRGAISALASDSIRPRLGASLMSLVRKQFTRPDRAEFPGDDAFRFAHILVRDTVYESTSKALRAELHERFADWLEAKARGSDDEVVAYHVEQAHRYRTELWPGDERARALAIRAAKKLAVAGERAFARTDMPAAADLFGRAWRLFEDDDPVRLQLGIDLAVALGLSGEHAAADAVLAEVRDRAERLGDERLHAYAQMFRIVQGLRPELSPTAMRSELERSIEIFERAGDEPALADAWIIVAETYWIENRAGGHAETLGRALEHAKRAGSRSRELTPILSHLATGLAHGPAPVREAIDRCRELHAIGRSNRLVEGAIWRALGRLEAMRGNFEEARSLMGRGVERQRELGLPVLAAGSFGTGLGFIEVLAGDLAAAERVLRTSVDELEARGETGLRSTNAAELAAVVYRLSRVDEADELTRLSEALAAPEDVASQGRWRLIRAKVHARRGEHGQAERLAREGLAVVEATDFLSVRGEAWLDLAEVLELAGRRTEAAQAADSACRLFESKGNVVAAARARRFLAELHTT